MQTNEFVYTYTNNMLLQVLINKFQQISSINPYNIHSATKYRPVFVVLMLNNSALDRLYIDLASVVHEFAEAKARRVTF